MAALSPEQQVRLNAFRQTARAMRMQVRIGRKYYEAIVETLSASEVYVSGGTGETGGFKVHVAIADLAHAPKKFTPIQVEGSKEMSILDSSATNGVTYEITAGDPSTEER